MPLPKERRDDRTPPKPGKLRLRPGDEVVIELPDPERPDRPRRFRAKIIKRLGRRCDRDRAEKREEGESDA